MSTPLLPPRSQPHHRRSNPTAPPRIPEPRTTPHYVDLRRITASRYVQGLNDRLRMEFISADWCTIGNSKIAHRPTLREHENGILTVEPACGVGYWGSGADRIQALERPSRYCRRSACVHDTPDRAAPSITVSRPAQLSLMSFASEAA